MEVLSKVRCRMWLFGCMDAHYSQSQYLNYPSSPTSHTSLSSPLHHASYIVHPEDFYQQHYKFSSLRWDFLVVC